MQDIILKLCLIGLIQSCYQSSEKIPCLETIPEKQADTLVVGNLIDGVIHKDCNFVVVSDKYLNGYTDTSNTFELEILLYTAKDSLKLKIEGFILKRSKTGLNFVDYIQWIHDESTNQTFDRSLPYIIHPVTGNYNRIWDGLVTRRIIDENQVTIIQDHVEEITNWPTLEWDENTTNNYSIAYNNNMYYGNCKKTIPESVKDLLMDFGIVEFNGDE